MKPSLTAHSHTKPGFNLLLLVFLNTSWGKKIFRRFYLTKLFVFKGLSLLGCYLRIRIFNTRLEHDLRPRRGRIEFLVVIVAVLLDSATVELLGSCDNLLEIDCTDPSVQLFGFLSRC